MNNIVYIYHHLGLGDHITANGMVRTITKKYDKTFLFCKPHNFKNVSFMYRDLHNLKLILMNDIEVRSFIKLNPSNNYIIAGHEKFWEIFNSPNNTLQLDEIFYSLANVPIENKWKEFFVQRDIEKEKEVFKKLNLKEGDIYAFVHDDLDRKITKNLPNMKIIKPDNKELLIFDYLYTIENATEIHCINSSFFCLIECIGIKKDKMFLHEYARTDIGKNTRGLIKSPWIILK